MWQGYSLHDIDQVAFHYKYALCNHKNALTIWEGFLQTTCIQYSVLFCQMLSNSQWVLNGNDFDYQDDCLINQWDINLKINNEITEENFKNSRI